MISCLSYSLSFATDLREKRYQKPAKKTPFEEDKGSDRPLSGGWNILWPL